MKLHLLTAFLFLGALACGTFAAEDKKEPAKHPEAAAPGNDKGGKASDPASDASQVPELDPETAKSHASYGFGFRSGAQFARQTVRLGLTPADIEREAFVKGFFDAFAQKESSISQENINTAANALIEAIKQREKKIAQENIEAGKEFLARNKEREEVVTTPSGLQYEVLEKGEGPVYEAPSDGAPPNKTFMVKYRGTLIDGTEFDSSEGKAVPMSLNVIPGFKEALTTMPVGAKWKLFIPSELAYKDQRRSNDLGPNSTLIFELELEEIKDAPKPPGRARAVSPPVRIPPAPKDQGGKPGKKATAVSPPVGIPPAPKDKNDKPKDKPKAKATAVSPPIPIPVKPPSEEDDEKEPGANDQPPGDEDPAPSSGAKDQ